MSRWFSWLAPLFLFALVGCGSDMHEILINETIGHVENAGTKTKAVQEELAKAQKEAGGVEPKYRDSPEVIKSIQKAEEAADDLKKVGVELAKTKQKIDLLKEQITPEQQAENVKKHRNRLNSVVESVYSAHAELETTINQIEKSGKNAKEALKTLQDKLREANSQFDSLVRPR